MMISVMILMEKTEMILMKKAEISQAMILMKKVTAKKMILLMQMLIIKLMMHCKFNVKLIQNV
jgi:hypothetical protein